MALKIRTYNRELMILTILGPLQFHSGLSLAQLTALTRSRCIKNIDETRGNKVIFLKFFLYNTRTPSPERRSP